MDQYTAKPLKVRKATQDCLDDRNGDFDQS
jgi:hypothetical protein